MTILRRCLPLLAAFALLLPAASTHAGAILDGPNARITDAGLGQYDDAELPNLAVLGNSVYATWLDDRYGSDNSVFFARSADGGATWGENVLVSALPYDDWTENPQIAAQPDGTLWIVWYLFYAEDSNKVNDLRLARSTDDGATWERFDLKDGTGHDDLWKTRIAADAENVYVLFHDYKSTDADDGYEIVLYTLDAATLEIRETLVNDVPRSGRITDGILDDGPNIDFALRNTSQGAVMCAAWEDQRERFALYSACSTDGGAAFAASVAFSGPDAVNPQIALALDGTLYVTYSLDSDSDKNIILRKSSDLGQSWSEPQQLTNIDAADEVESWDLAVDGGGQIVLPWVEAFYGESNLNLATSSDGGASFATLVDIEDDQGEFPTVSDQREVAVALGSGEGADERAYIAWRDDRNVKDEIWFTRAVLDGTPPTAPTNVQAQPGDTVVALSWTAATDANGVAGYRVYRASSTEGPFVQISPLLVRGTGFVDVGLSADQPHAYQIAAVDGTGNLSPRSAVVSAAATVGDAGPSGTLIYERGDAARLHPMSGGEESAITDARDPVLSTDGTQLFYRSGDSIGFRPISGDGSLGEPQPFFTREGLADFDVAADGVYFAMLVQRFQANLNSGGCFVFEPIYANASQDFYTDQYNYSSYVSISADRRWMAYRYDGFCTINASGFTEPGDFCIANLSTQEKKCIEGANIDGSDFAPAANANGSSEIVFASPVSGQHEIWRAQVADDGSLLAPVQLTSGPANQPANNPRFSSNAEWITFQRDVNPDTADDAEDWRLFAVRTDGSSLRDLGVAGEKPVLLSGGSASGPDATSTPAPGTTPAPLPTAQPTGGSPPAPLPEGVGTRTYLPVVTK